VGAGEGSAAVWRLLKGWEEVWWRVSVVWMRLGESAQKAGRGVRILRNFLGQFS
jgi:hypothetical protein